jgi:ADP-ribose pyrophosphatase YjhB (NUDIX family)
MFDFTINPFVSEAQRRACYAKQKAGETGWDCAKWEEHTPKGKKLPKRKATTNQRARKQFPGSISSQKARRTKLKTKGINPLKVDPTRTGMMRRKFITDLKRQFDLLKGRIVKLIVDENALGIGITTHNAFCPTGPGGGQDNSCAPGPTHREGDRVTYEGKEWIVTTAKKMKSGPDKGRTRIMMTLPDHSESRSRYGDEIPPGHSAGEAPKPAPPKAPEPEPAGTLKGTVPSPEGEMAHFSPEKGGVLFHGTGHEHLDLSKGGETYMALDYDETHAFATGEVVGTGGSMTGRSPNVARMIAKPGKTIDVSAELEDALFEGDRTESDVFNDAKKKGARYVTFNHPSNVGRLEFQVVVALHPKEDLTVSKQWKIAAKKRNVLGGAIRNTVTVRNVKYKHVEGSYQVIVDNQRWQFHSDPQKLEAFQSWLRSQNHDLLTAQTQHDLWERYVQQGWRRGAGRSFDDVRTSKLRKKRPELFTTRSQESVRDFYAGTRDEFLRSSFNQPVAVEKVKLLAERAFDELENVTTDMGNKIARALANGMVEGKGAMQIARDMTEQVDISRARANMIARTEIIRAHAEGQLMALRRLGVENVGVAVEWSTSRDNAVCELCEPMEGVVLKLDEAAGLIPRHPNAVFAGSSFVPYGECYELVRAQYSGPAVVLVLAGNHRTTIGPNHPVLTNRGMVKAAEVNEGDEVIFDTRFNRSVSPTTRVDKYSKLVPLLENIFESVLSLGDDSLVSTSASDLHGDRNFCQGEVQAIRPTRSLLVVAEPQGLEKLRKLDLTRPDTETKFVPSDSPSILGSRRVYLPSPSVMGGPNSWVVADSHFIYLRVVEKQLTQYTGWAFDASTASSLYCSDGFVVSNCRCAWLPANVGEDEEGQIRDLDDVEDALSESDMDDVEVDEDRPRGIFNAFCPTGPGGGVNPHCSPGTHGVPVGHSLTKVYQGRSYTVTATATGFQVDFPGGMSKHYPSITAAAKGVRGTSTPINGWAFFGARNPKLGPAPAAAPAPAPAPPVHAPIPRIGIPPGAAMPPPLGMPPAPIVPRNPAPIPTPTPPAAPAAGGRTGISGLPLGDVYVRSFGGVRYTLEVGHSSFKVTNHNTGYTTYHSSISAAAMAAKGNNVRTNGWAFWGVAKPAGHVFRSSGPRGAGKAARSPGTAPTVTTGNVAYQAEHAWTTGNAIPGQTLNGVAFEPVKDRKFWEHTPDVNIHEPPPLNNIDRVGIMIREKDGRIWIAEPTNHYGHRNHTLPGGTIESGLTMQQNAIKETWEETGLQCRITGHLGDFQDSNYKGANRWGRLYLGERIGGAPWDAKVEPHIINRQTGQPDAESSSVKLVTPEKARERLHRMDDLAQLVTVAPIPVKSDPTKSLIGRFMDGIAPAAQQYVNERGSKGRATGDEQLHVIQELRGFNGKPKLVSKSDMDNLVKPGGTHIEVLRGIANTYGRTAKQMVESYKTGSHFPGYGCFGSGTYTDGTKGYNNVAAPGSTYAGDDTLRIAIPKTAKIIEQSALEAACDPGMYSGGKYPKGDDGLTPYTGHSGGGHSAGRSWQGLQAALAGYDAIHVGGDSKYQNTYGNSARSKDGGFYVILNRSITSVQKDDARGHVIR